MEHLEKNMNFDVVIIGGGHAGCEAAWIASEFNLRVAIISMPGVPLASTPCNPAVGGVGKGQVVRELDAMGGLMGRVADLSGIQYRILNESKGPAVQSTRVQVDKDLYAANARLCLDERGINIIEEKVVNVERVEDGFRLRLGDDQLITSLKCIITAGTFLSGKLHTGSDVVSGGRVGCDPSEGMNSLVQDVKKLKIKFKTGTPARLSKSTLDFSKMEEQPSDDNALNFHFAHKRHDRHIPQVSCYLSHTTEKTLEIIRFNKDRSPLFNGQIIGVGPRYCPSIEDKAYRYPDKDVHHVFLEPEGINSDSVYPNGLSTSLPKDVQAEFVRTIPGLEKAEILVHGYAVEYEVVDTSELDLTLQYKNIPGLYFAGQVNGTSGYEEAAGQGFIAGVNASLVVLGLDPLILDRTESYIGVMIEDLVTSQRDEPYRLFTARSENRLYLREDNTFNRMAKYRLAFGLNNGLDSYYHEFLASFEVLNSLCHEISYKSDAKTKQYFLEQAYGELDSPVIKLSELLKRSKLDPIKVLTKELSKVGLTFDENVVRAVAVSQKYEGYINRSNQEFLRVHRVGKRTVNWEKLLESPNISFECKQRIKDVKPLTFTQLQKIEGIRPATLAVVAGSLLS